MIEKQSLNSAAVADERSMDVVRLLVYQCIPSYFHWLDGLSQSLSINQHPWTSINIGLHQLTTLNFNEHQLRSVSINKHIIFTNWDQFNILTLWTRSNHYINLMSFLNHHPRPARKCIKFRPLHWALSIAIASPPPKPLCKLSWAQDVRWIFGCEKSEQNAGEIMETS